MFRIGQKRDVIVYRLVTMGTIEEKIYRRQIYKKGMNLATIDQQGGNSQADFEKYFKNTDLFELFQFDADAAETTCETLQLLLNRDGFPFEETPTNVRHVAFLRAMDSLVKGITLNTNLYTNKEQRSDNEETLLPKQADDDSDMEESSSSTIQRKRASKKQPI